MEQGLLASCLDAGDLAEALEVTAAIGYRNCEISVCEGDRRPNLATIDDAARKAAMARAGELGLTVSAVQCHLHNGYADACPDVRARAVDHTVRMIDVCAALGIPVLHTVSGVAEDDAAWEAKLARLAESYAAILDHAAGTSVRVGIEPVFAYTIGNLEHTRALLSLLDERPDLYINYDPSHFPYHDEPAEDFIKVLGGRIIHAHSKDAVVRPVTASEPADQMDRWAMSGDRYFQFVPPGKGDLDWDAIFAALARAGYDHVLSLEMGHGYEGRPRDVAREVYEFFKDGYGIG